MTPIKRRLTYFFRENGNALLRLRIRWNGNTYNMSVGYKIDRTDSKGKEKWDGHRCKASTFHGPDKTPASTINKALENLEERIDKAFYSFEIADTVPTADDLKKILTSNNKRRSLPEIETAYNQFVIDREKYNQWSFNTVKTVKNIGNLIKKFRPNLSFRDINDDLLREFVVWQQANRLSEDEYKTQQTGYSNPVILKNCRIFKWFLEWASQKGYVPSDVVARFKPSLKSIEKTVVFLEWDELLKMESYPFEEEEQRQARDFFCFCCFTSLRYSDAYALKKTSVHQDYFEIVSQKTDKVLKIDLNHHSRQILERYANDSGEYALPRLTVARLNVLVKRLGETLELNTPVNVTQYYGNHKVERTLKKYELLSTHSGRRTFICNALAMGIPAHIVMKWTGHSDYAAMKPYIGVADDVRANAMKIFDNTDSLAVHNGDKSGDKNAQSQQNPYNSTQTNLNES